MVDAPIYTKVKLVDSICREVVQSNTTIPVFSIDSAVKPSGTDAIEATLHSSGPLHYRELVFFPSDPSSGESQYRRIIGEGYARLEARVLAHKYG